jgi:flagellar hook assembly protein FlgD
MLLPGRPNPFRTMATIAYRLNEPGPVSLEVFDVTGRLVSTLREGREEPGFHRVCWNGADRSGRALPSGVYLYRLRTAAGEQSRKLLLER